MGFADFFVGLLPVHQSTLQPRMCFLLSNILPEEEKEGEQQMLAGVAASVLFPRGFSGFALFAVGRGPAPDANGGQVAVRVGMCGSAHADPDPEAQTQRPHPGVRQRCMAGVFHKFERSARTPQTAPGVLRRGVGLPVGALF